MKIIYSIKYSSSNTGLNNVNSNTAVEILEFNTNGSIEEENIICTYLNRIQLNILFEMVMGR